MIKNILRFFGYRLVPIPEGESRKKPKFEKATQQGDIIIFYYSDQRTRHFKGSNTVWHELPFMGRCSTPIEYKLCDIEGYVKQWGNPYPTAHLKEKTK